MRIVFIGPPGAGKGTQSLRVAEKLGVTHLSTGDVLRNARDSGEPIGEQAAEYLEDGRLVPDDLVLKLVSQRLTRDECLTGYVFDGFPRTVAQAEALDKLLQERCRPLDAALQFVVPDEELFQRLSARGREDDNDETIRERLRFYESLTAPLVDYYDKQGILRKIDAVGSPEEVFARVGAALNGVDVA